MHESQSLGGQLKKAQRALDSAKNAVTNLKGERQKASDNWAHKIDEPQDRMNELKVIIDTRTQARDAALGIWDKKMKDAEKDVKKADAELEKLRKAKAAGES